MQKMKKLFRELGKVCFLKALQSMYPHLTEDSEIFFEVGSDGACSRNTRTTSHHLNDRLREELGCRNKFITFGYHTNESKAEYKIFISQTD